MLDFVYVLTTVVFFAVMVLYVAACDRLGHTADVDRATKDQP